MSLEQGMEEDERRRSQRVRFRLMLIGAGCCLFIVVIAAMAAAAQQGGEDSSAKAIVPGGGLPGGLDASGGADEPGNPNAAAAATTTAAAAAADAAGTTSSAAAESAAAATTTATTTPLPPPPPPTPPPPPPPPPPLVTYSYLGYDGIVERLRNLQDRFPDLVEIYNTQDRFGLDSPGTCYVDGGLNPCKVWVIVVTNKALRTADTPEVFYSGTIHGDERVGPTAVTEFVTLLLERYGTDAWARRLVDTRVLTAVPAANSLGYSRNERTENGLDPNRDFAWDQDAGSCMQTIAARSINELWLRHVYQLSVTFHGGASLVAYPWGDTIHCTFESYYCRTGWTAPDMTGMDTLTRAIASYVGQFSGIGRYLTGALNDPAVIYPVKGGMEDWAYGASWSPPGPVPCAPGGGRFAHYGPERTAYNNVTHRAVNLLVETADAKTPPATSLGDSSQVFLAGGGNSGDGHVTRNIRLCLLLADAVRPYVELVSPENVPTSVSAGLGFAVTFRVGGAFHLDQAQVVCEDAHGASVCDASGPMEDMPLWSLGSRPDPISAQVMISPFLSPGVVRVYVRAKVDQGWAGSARPEAYLGLPQSHLVRARTDGEWYGRVEDSAVHGQVWYSSAALVVSVNGGRRRAVRSPPAPRPR